LADFKEFSMPQIQIFDPALCCSSGVCGPELDEQLVRAAADIDWARSQGGSVERFNLAQQPLAFAENALVREFLERAGQGALPLTLLDGQLVLAGRYPGRDQLAQWLGLAAQQAGAPVSASGACCSGGKCC
jgi:hypothetical protein